MDRQMSFLQMWAMTVQPMCERALELFAELPEGAAQAAFEAFLDETVESAKAHEPENSSHDFLVEFVTTATHYANLLVQYGCFDDDQTN